MVGEMGMVREKCGVLENKKVATGHFVLTMRSPEIASKATPGQFVQVLCSDGMDPLLPRPFSFLSANKKEFSILYQVVGKGTALLAQAKRGDSLWVLGPLGNGFSIHHPPSPPLKRRRAGTIPTRPAGGHHPILVGGGVGIPPLYHLAQSFSRRQNIHVFLGARNKSLLLCENDFKKLKVNLHVATDDGSKGTKGLVTKPLEDFLKKVNPKDTKIYTCGPTPMLKAVSLLSQKYRVDCEVSVEEPMACGFGVCLGCAIKVKGPRFAMACTEGPVFKASQVLWD